MLAAVLVGWTRAELRAQLRGEVRPPGPPRQSRPESDLCSAEFSKVEFGAVGRGAVPLRLAPTEPSARPIGRGLPLAWPLSAAGEYWDLALVP